jgi:hypothetical protein
MSHSDNDGPPDHTVSGVGRVTLVLLVVVVIVGGVPLRAGAALVAGGGSGNGNGNGRHNRNSISVNSPEFNHGIQHITNTNASGIAANQAAFCRKKFRHCRINQHLNVFDP